MNKMKKFKCVFVVLLAVFSLTTVTTLFAAEKAVEKKAAEKKSVVTTIHLYASPEASAKIIKELPATTNLVGIYQKGNWMKVGDREDGSTGWINLSQYHQARNSLYDRTVQINSESIYIHEEKDKNGKTNIVAYKNGKKLSDADAKKLYQHMQEQGRQEWDAMQHELMMPSMLFMPNIVVIEKPAQTKKQY